MLVYWGFCYNICPASCMSVWNRLTVTKCSAGQGDGYPIIEIMLLKVFWDLLQLLIFDVSNI